MITNAFGVAMFFISAVGVGHSVALHDHFGLIMSAIGSLACSYWLGRRMG